MSEPLYNDPENKIDDGTSLPVEIDLEAPEADVVEQSLVVELDVEGHSYG